MSPSRRLAIILLSGLAGCGGGGGEPSPPAPVIAKVSGDEQTDTVGQTLAHPVQVLVTQGNAPVSGATVTWSPGLFDDVLVPATVVTGADGLAATEWTLGTNIGVHTITAQVEGSTEASINFTATAIHDAPAGLAIITGNNQTGMANTPIRSLTAKVGDQFSNGIPGIQVNWSISDGTVTPEVDLTDPSGESTVDVTLGNTPGPVTITASAEGLSDITFNATAQPVPTEASVMVGNNSFTSERNSSSTFARWAVPASPAAPKSQGAARATRILSARRVRTSTIAVHGSLMTGRVVVR